jgi:hypothetical protein
LTDDSIKQTAIAIAKTAEATKAAISGTAKMGQFISKFVEGPLGQISGIVEDRLKYMRMDNQLSLIEKSNRKLIRYGLEPNKVIPLKLAIPLLEYSSLEDEDYLQEVWANLLVNAGTSQSGIDVKMIYVEILKGLSSLEVQILKTVYTFQCEDYHKGIVTKDLPFKVDTFPKGFGSVSDDRSPPISEDLKLSLSNLDRLGCILLARSIGGGLIFSSLNPTLLGKKFVTACSDIELE